FYSILRSGKYQKDQWLILLLIIQWFVMTSHLENFLLIAVAVLYDYINRGFKKRIHLTLIGFFLIGLTIEVLTFSAYEMSKVTPEDDSASLLNLLDSSYLTDL